MSHDLRPARKPAQMPQTALVPAQPAVTVLASRSLFWHPRHAPASPMTVLVPFVFWLTDTLRPTSFACLGAGDGTAHFALCQAADQLDLAARGYACGPWQGGQAEVPAALAQHNAENYPDMSRLSDSTPRAAAARFPRGSVDLLVVDLAACALTDATVERLLVTDWAPRLSARGVILFSGAETVALARLIRNRPMFRLETGPDLLLVQWGAEPEPRIADLCRMGIGSSAYAAFQKIFSRLGAAATAEARAEAEAERAAALEQRLAMAEQAAPAAPPASEGQVLAELTAANAALTAEVQHLHQHLAAAQDMAARRAAELARKADEAEALLRQAARTRDQVAALEQHLAAYDSSQGAPASREQVLAARLARQADEIAERDREIADLKQRLSAQRHKQEVQATEHAKAMELVRLERDATQALLARRERDLEALRGVAERDQ